MAGKAGRRAWGWVRKLPSGHWHASYLGPDRRRHNAPLTYTKKINAEGWLADERRLIEQEAWTPPAERAAAKVATRVTLAAYAATVVAERTLKPRTRLHYESLLRLYVNDTIGKVPIGAITQSAIRSWHANSAAHRRSRRTGRTRTTTSSGGARADNGNQSSGPPGDDMPP